MIVTNMELVNAKEPLETLIRTQLPVKTALAVLTMAKKFNEHLQIIQGVRVRLIQEYGTPSKENEGDLEVLPDNPNWVVFHEKLGELYSTETTVDIEPVLLPDTLLVSPQTLMALDKFIKFE